MAQKGYLDLIANRPEKVLVNLPDRKVLEQATRRLGIH